MLTPKACKEQEFALSPEKIHHLSLQTQLLIIAHEYRNHRIKSKQGDNQSSDRGGTGLGLSISQKFADLMNGELLVSSKMGQSMRP